jgi:hypothetical protein
MNLTTNIRFTIEAFLVKYMSAYFEAEGLGSVVGIATGYGLDGPVIES